MTTPLRTADLHAERVVAPCFYTILDNSSYYTDICSAEGIGELTDQNGFQSCLAFSSADITLTTSCSRESEIQHSAFLLSLCCALAANEKKYLYLCERRTLILHRGCHLKTLRRRDSRLFCPAENFTEMLKGIVHPKLIIYSLSCYSKLL